MIVVNFVTFSHCSDVPLNSMVRFEGHSSNTPDIMYLMDAGRLTLLREVHPEKK